MDDSILFSLSREKNEKDVYVKVMGNLVLPYVDCDAYRESVTMDEEWTNDINRGSQIESGRMICGGLSSGGIYRGSINRVTRRR